MAYRRFNKLNFWEKHISAMKLVVMNTEEVLGYGNRT